MQIEVLTLRYDPARGVMDDTALRAFTRDKVVLGVRDHFFQSGSIAHLVLVIEYRLPAPSAGDGSDGRRKPDGVSQTDALRSTLDPGVREVFDLLRAWRSRVAQEEGVPAYAVLSNAQLAAIARERPSSRAGLNRIAITTCWRGPSSVRRGSRGCCGRR